MFAGASHTLLTWVVFAFETTRQPLGLLPLLGGTAAAYLIAGMGMRDSIMTQKISRRGVPLTMGPEVDFLRQQTVRQWAATPVATLEADESVVAARTEIENARHKHQGFPVIDAAGLLIGVITRRELSTNGVADAQPVRSLLTRAPVIVFDDATLREAADIMVQHNIGRLPVVTRLEPRRPVGIITRSDLLMAHAPRLRELTDRDPSFLETRAWRERRKSRRAP